MKRYGISLKYDSILISALEVLIYVAGINPSFNMESVSHIHCEQDLIMSRGFTGYIPEKLRLINHSNLS